MKSIQLFFALVLLAVFTTSVSAKNYYVCDTGDDRNNGSQSSPFRSYAKAMDTFNKMFAGDSVLFCRGGKFTVSKNSYLFNKRCSRSSVCTLADYGNSTLRAPFIVINKQGVNGLSFSDGGNANQDGGYFVKNLTLKSDAGKGSGIFLFNDIDDLTIDNLHIEGFNVGLQAAGHNALDRGANNFNERIVLKNSTIINNSLQGWLGGCSDCRIENNHFEGNGSTKTFDHNIYIASQNGNAVPDKGITIKGNTLYKSAVVDGKCYGVSLVVHGLIDDLTIEGNTIKEDAGTVNDRCWGISVDPGYGSIDEAFHNVVIKNNTLINMGNVAIGCASCDGVIIQDNFIIDEGGILTHGISVPVRKEDTVKSKNVTISGNTTILSNANGSGISINGEHKFEVKLNTISQPAGAKSSCILKKGANSSTNTANNTCKNHTSLPSIDQVQINAIKTEVVISQNIESEVQAQAQAQAQAVAQARAKEDVRAAAQEAAIAAAKAAQAKAAAIQAKAVLAQTQEKVQAQKEQRARAQAASEAAAKAEAQAQVAAAKQEKAQQAAAKVKEEALPVKQVVDQSQVSKNENSKPADPDTYKQEMKLGGSGAGARSGWSTGTSASSGTGWSGTKSTVTYTDVVNARDNIDSTQPKADDDCRATANGKCLLK